MLMAADPVLASAVSEAVMERGIARQPPPWSRRPRSTPP